MSDLCPWFKNNSFVNLKISTVSGTGPEAADNSVDNFYNLFNVLVIYQGQTFATYTLMSTVERTKQAI